MAPPVGLEPNDNVRYAHYRVASDLAHNPRKRGDGALLANRAGGSKKARRSVLFLAPPVGLEPTTP